MNEREQGITRKFLVKARADLRGRPINLHIVYQYIKDQLQIDDDQIEMEDVSHVFDVILSVEEKFPFFYKRYIFQETGDLREVPYGVLKIIYVLWHLEMFENYNDIFNLYYFAGKVATLLSHGNDYHQNFDSRYELSSRDCDILNNLIEDYYRRRPLYEHRYEEYLEE